MGNVTLPPGVTKNAYVLSPGDKLLGHVDGSSVLDGWVTIPKASGLCEVGGFTFDLRQADGTTVQSGGIQWGGSGGYGHDLGFNCVGLTAQQGIQVQDAAADVRLDNIKGWGLRGPAQHHHLIYARSCLRLTITDVEMWDWNGGWAVHAYTSAAGESVDQLLVDRLHVHDCANGGVAFAWNGVKRATFRNLTQGNSRFTSHLFSCYYATGPVVFDRVKTDLRDFYFGPGVVLTNEGVADLPDFSVPAPVPPPDPAPEPVPEPVPPEVPQAELDELAATVALLEKRELALDRSTKETPNTSVSKKYQSYRPKA